jgi:hypothetical protein
MQDFAAQADAVIFDTSPTTSSSDAIALLQPEGQTIIVVKIGQTPRVALKAMAQDLRQHGLQNAAIVLSNTEELHSGLTSQSPAPGQRTGESDLPASTVAAW